MREIIIGGLLVKQTEIFDEVIQEECGVFGIYDSTNTMDVARLTYYGLYALQHRGQESCGIAVNNVDENDNIQMLHYKDTGLLQEVFNDLVLRELTGYSAIGHVRAAIAKVKMFSLLFPDMKRVHFLFRTMAHWLMWVK